LKAAFCLHHLYATLASLLSSRRSAECGRALSGGNHPRRPSAWWSRISLASSGKLRTGARSADTASGRPLPYLSAIQPEQKRQKDESLRALPENSLCWRTD